MSASVYQGESRRVVRWTIVLLLLKTIQEMITPLMLEPPDEGTLHAAPLLLRWPFLWPPVAVLLALGTAFLMVQFGRRRSPTRWGTAGFLMLLYLGQVQTALTGETEHELCICAALLGGWIFGVFFLRALDARATSRGLASRGVDPDRDDAFGEAGAAGALVAVYLDAAFSKLLGSGIHWADGAQFLSSVVSRHQFSTQGGLLDGMLAAILPHPGLATLMALATLLIQGGSFLYLVSPRMRMLIGTLVIGFHLNAFLLMGVRYFSPIIAMVGMSYPWPRIWRRLRGLPQPAPRPDPERDFSDEDLRAVTRQAAVWIACVAAASLVLWVALHHADDFHLFREHGRARGHANMHGGGPHG